MKFGVRLMKEMVQEWKDEYVDYFGLKRRLDAVVAETLAGRPRADSPEPGADEDESPLLVELRPLETGDDFEREVELRSLGRQRVVGLATSASFRASAAAPGAAQKAFYAALDADVARVEAFYLRMLQDLDVRASRVAARGGGSGVAEELMQVHLLCALLCSFCELNATAVAKIAKKHDKLLGVAWKGAYTSAAARGTKSSTRLRRERSSDARAARRALAERHRFVHASARARDFWPRQSISGAGPRRSGAPSGGPGPRPSPRCGARSRRPTPSSSRRATCRRRARRCATARATTRSGGRRAARTRSSRAPWSASPRARRRRCSSRGSIWSRPWRRSTTSAGPLFGSLLCPRSTF
jgi:hypothetical protein